MSGGATTAAQLLKMADQEFQSNIQDMNVKKLLETISVLQKEMGREQENFNSLSAELGNLKKNSGQYKSVSKDMAASQKRLTSLMDRSMKCFSQQGQQQSKEPVLQKASANQNRHSADLSKIKIETSTLKPFVEVKSSEDNDQSSMTEPVSSTRTSFAEVKNRFNGNSQNGATNVGRGNTNVPVDIKRPRSMVTTQPYKQQSGNVSNGIATTDSSTPKSDIGLVKPSSIPKTSVGPTVSSNVSTKPVSSTSKTAMVVGPMASQGNKFLSKSSDTLFNQQSNGVDDRNVVRGNVSSSKPKVVMTADRQFLDLDSFTDRKNLLSELKSFDKELKPVAKADPSQPKLVKGFGLESVPKEEKVAGHKVSFLSDIKLGKKPSAVKNGEVEHNTKQETVVITTKTRVVDTQKTVQGEIKNGVNESKSEIVDEVDGLNGKVDKVMVRAGVDEPKVNFGKTGVGAQPKVNVGKAGVGEPKVNVGKAGVGESKVNIGEAGVGEITVENQKEPVSSQSEDSASQSSELSEDEDKFVTEFSFPPKQTAVTTKNNDKLGVTVNKQEVKPVNKPQSGTQPIVTKPAGKTHVVRDNEEVLGAAARNQPEYNDDGEELVKQTRVNYSDWDPSLLLAELYKIKYMPDNIEDISHKFVGMEGLMEKLPMNKKKATLLKTWKRRFFRAKDGWLHYYESSNREKPSDSLQLMGGKVEELGNQVLGIDDGRGKYLMVRVPTGHEYGQWRVALDSQTADNVKATYVRPAPASAPNPKKKVVVIDLGSSGIRAGVLGERATLPHVFFPSVVAIHKQTKEIVVGANALKPEIRKSSTIVYPIRPTNKVDKFNIDMEVMSAILKKVFTDLKVNPKDYLVMLSTPQTLGNSLKEGLMRIFMNQLHTKGVCMVQQALLSLYSYNAMSGIIVDIGERLEILPIYEGLLIESGLSHQAYGGTKIQDSMYISLLENRYQFLTPVGRLVVRYICEQSCHVVEDYKAAQKECDKDATQYKRTIDLLDYQLPPGAHESVTLNDSCFKSPEGFFNTDLWEMDYKNIQKQIFAAIQQCPMDARKQMYRSIYLSGGVTMIPGFAERLQVEMEKLAPSAAVVEVHASPQRYHSAYIGACAVAMMEVFEMSCVMADEWNKMGVQACRKWGTN